MELPMLALGYVLAFLAFLYLAYQFYKVEQKIDCMKGKLSQAIAAGRAKEIECEKLKEENDSLKETIRFLDARISGQMGIFEEGGGKLG